MAEKNDASGEEDDTRRDNTIDNAATTPLFSYFRLLSYGAATWLDISLIGIGALCAIASGIPFPLMAILFGELVNDINSASCEVDNVGSAQAYEAAINDRVLQLVYIAIAALILIFVYVVCWSVFSHRLAHRLREDYFRNLLHQDQAFIDRNQIGEVSSRLNRDVQSVQSGTCEKVGIFISSLSFFITAYVIAFIQEARLAGMLISLIPAFLLVAIVGGAFFQKYSTIMSDAAAKGSNIASEALSQIAVVQAFCAGSRLEQRFAQDMQRSRENGIRKGLIAATQAGFLYFIAYSANSLAFWQGSRMIADFLAGEAGGSTVGEIYTVVFILVDACVILGAAAPLLPIFGNAASAYENLKDDIDHEALIDGLSEAGQVLSPDTKGDIEFRNVSFEYPSRKGDRVLHNINLKFPFGKYTAIVGPSGSGKSTIAALITRLYDPIEGDIFLDGNKLSDLNVRNLRGFTSFVSQEPSLLNRSIFENIALGLVNSPSPSHQYLQELLIGPELPAVAAKASESINSDILEPVSTEIMKLVQQAASQADASGFIEQLEKGYSTIIGLGGQSLSGGQRQRVALARALVRDPKILILDEATASLDSLSEQRIQGAIDNFCKDRTVISIAHRLSTIKNADNIVVMKAGKVVDQGTYSELAARPGVFRELVELQGLESWRRSDAENMASHLSDLSSDQEHSASMGSANKLSSINQELDATGGPISTAESKTPSTGLDSNLSSWRVMKNMKQFIRPQLHWLVIAAIAAFVVGCTFSAAGLIFGHTVGALSPCDTTIDRVLYLGRFFAGMLFMVAGVEFFANFISWSSFALVAERLLYQLRVLSFRSLLLQNLEWHQSADRHQTELLSVITKDSAAIGGFSGSTMGTMFSILVNFLVAVILSHIIAWKIAVVCLTMIPILLGSGILQLRSFSRFEERHSKAYANALAISSEAVSSFRMVATFSLEQQMLSTYNRALSEPRKEIIAASVYTNAWLAISNSTGFFVYAFAYWWGSRQVIRGENSQEDFFIILVAMLISAQLWGQAFSLAPEVSRARASASRILDLIRLGSNHDPLIVSSVLRPSKRLADQDIEKSAVDELVAPSTPFRGASVSFRSVWFSYSSRHKVTLQNVSIFIDPGQFCGLVGPSGAGKSTMFNLIQNVYMPTSGNVEIDGTKVSNRDFRDDIAVVPQLNSLFSGTIRFNVGLGARQNREATLEEIQDACKLSNIHDTIMALPDQYDTECGPNGSFLSGGQRQRLAIARALVRKPRLLLLDESTSALDAETEDALQEGLERAIRGSGITIIAITHRLHTIMKADVIFVVEGGQIVDSGRHTQLIQRCETYRLNALQQMLR